MSPLSFKCLFVIIVFLQVVDGSMEMMMMMMATTEEQQTSDNAVSLISIMLSRFQCPHYSSCQKCITNNTIKDILDNGHPQDSSENYSTAAVFITWKANEICSHLDNETLKTFCTNQSCIKEWADNHLTKAAQKTVDKMKVEAFLRDIESKYIPATNTCVTSRDILSEEKSGTNNTVSSVMAVIWSHLIRGHCFKLENDPIENIFEHYGTTKPENNYTKEPVLHSKEIQHLLTDINHVISECTLTLKAIRDEPSHSHSHRKRESQQKYVDNVSGCLNTDSLLKSTDKDVSLTVDVEEFKIYLCPAIIEQLTKVATHTVNNETNKNPRFADEMNSKSEMAYVYGTVAITLISLCSLLGALFIPNTKANSNKQQYILTGLIAMGFGILVGDALIHLVPQALGLHGDHHSEDVSHEHKEGNHLGKCIVMMAAIYFLFLFEGVCQAIFPDHSNNAHSHSNSKNQHAPGNKSTSQQTLRLSTFDVAVRNTETEETTAPLSQSPIICCGLRNLALIVIVGDTIHNMADGLVIGAAFAASIHGGITASIAIICHELPHELGDFAILLSTGLSRRRAIVVNLLSSFSAYVGFIIGISIGSDESAIQWMMSVTIGMFLFVALGDMMPELKSLRIHKPWTSLLIQNIAVLIGVSFTILMAIYEEEIKITL